MIIKTLTYIHNLLVEEQKKRYGAYTYIRECVTTAYCDNEPNAKYLEPKGAERKDPIT